AQFLTDILGVAHIVVVISHKYDFIVLNFAGFGHQISRHKTQTPVNRFDQFVEALFDKIDNDFQQPAFYQVLYNFVCKLSKQSHNASPFERLRL
ncbi:MAG: hypothetical protein IIY16_05350, partial [Oscillospiraceae bacterium]|nr:hypothetical protein [Oscillospiraceae bacterium]